MECFIANYKMNEQLLKTGWPSYNALAGNHFIK